MAEDARTQFVDGLRVSAEHLQHLQDRLRESVLDVRTAIGLGRVVWGLKATLNDAGSAVDLTPGVAFAPDGVRLAVDSALSVAVPADGDSLALVLSAVHGDREALRFNGLPTVLTVETRAQVGAPPAAGDAKAFVVATIARVGGVLSLTQNDALFTAAGAHGHTGTHVQDEGGRWHFDGARIAGGDGAGAAGPKGDPGAPGAPGADGVAGPKGDPGAVGPVGADGPAGAPGEPGAAGALGNQGATGLQGPSGADGALGPQGPQGQDGAAAAVGAQGVPGEKGVQGDPGAKGDPGAQGDPGQKGEPGIKGDSGQNGSVGPKGDTGEAGLVGQPGEAGVIGPAGPTGAQGDPGVAGPSGVAGTQGDNGPAGPTGDVGATGPAGLPGAAGLAGPKGDPGQPLDQDWGNIRKINWPHDDTLKVAAATTLLQAGLQVTFSRSLDPSQQDKVPNVFEVWFQPNPASPAASDTPLPIVSIFGTLRATPQTLTWVPNTSPGGFKATMRAGRLLVRVHCGALKDSKNRQFSATLAPVLGLDGLVLSGGVFESWFLVVP